ncbi:MAG: hypothetical protein M3Q07_12980 [Pseudobdellovibrionaceae bacterium]|nr:hypothetical protein [Pseudobdellovibrionaceae bacterium]
MKLRLIILSLFFASCVHNPNEKTENTVTKIELKCPETPRNLPNATCETVWKKYRSCEDAYGSWISIDVDAGLKERGCNSTPGCAIETATFPIEVPLPDPNNPSPPSGDRTRYYCKGTPVCTQTSHALNVCEAKQTCECNPGYKFYNQECKKIICDGKYVAGEYWSIDIDSGSLYSLCQGSGKLEKWVSCKSGFLIDKGALKCVTSIE